MAASQRGGVAALSLEEASAITVPTTISSKSMGGQGGGDGKWGAGLEEEQWWTPERLGWLYALLVAMVPVLMGYDAGVMSGSISDIRVDLSLSSSEEALAMAILNFVAAAGALFSGALGDMVGRKGALAVSALLALIGAAVTTFSESFTAFMWGRTIMGFGCGCGFLQAPVYTSEIVPPAVRGRMVALTDLSMNVGVLLGFSVSWLVAEYVSDVHSGWRYTAAVGMVLPLFILAAMLAIPESPRWLMSQGYFQNASDVVLLMSHSEGEASETLAGMKASLEQEHGDGGVAELVCPQDAFVRHAIMLVLLAGVAQQVNGCEAVIYYTPEMLQAAGLANEGAQLGSTVAVGACKVLGDVAAALLLDSWGRRPLMLGSSGGVAVCVALLGLVLVCGWGWGWLLFVLCAFMALFSLGLGAVTFLVANEVLPIRIRSKCVGLSVCLNRLVAGLTVVALRSAVSDEQTMGTCWLSVFLMGSLLTLGFYWWVLPETANKTLEEVQADMAQALAQQQAGGGSQAAGRGQGGHGGGGSKAYETIE